MSQLPSPLDGIQHDLLGRGLPATYVTRVVAELDEHKRDIADEPAAPEPPVGENAARLGSREELVREVVSKYQSRSFAGRHPVLTFVLAPIPALVLVWVLGVLVCIVAGRLIPVERFSLEAVVYACTGFNAFVTFVAPTAVVCWFCRLARRSARGVRWAVAATAIVGLVAFLMHTQIDPPINGPNTGRFMIGLGFGLRDLSFMFGFNQLAQLLLPVSVATLMCLRYRAAMRARTLTTA